MNTKINDHIELLGLKAKDKVTGLTGVIDSICFDLYGCVQATVAPAAKDGKIENSRWFDVTRLSVTHKKRVIDVPNFDKGYVAEGKKGPAEKPQR